MADVKVKGIISFPNLVTPKRGENPTDDAKYTVTVLIHESDPALAVVKQAFENLKVTSGWKPHQKIALRDCNLPSFTNVPPDPKLAGYWQVSCSSKESMKPHLVGPDGLPIIDVSLVYAGAEAWVVFNPYSYPNNGGGITAGLNGVMITGNPGALGRLDNRPTSEAMFGDIVAGVTPPAPGGVTPPAPGGAVVHTMLPAAAGGTYEAMIAGGWTDETLVANGMMAASATVAPIPNVPVATAMAPATSTVTPTSAPVAAPPPPAANPVLLPPANGQTYEQLIAAGWTDGLLRTNGMMQ